MKIVRNRIFLAVICAALALVFLLVFAGANSTSDKLITGYRLGGNAVKGSQITESMLVPETVGAYGMGQLLTEKEDVLNHYTTSDLLKGQLLFNENVSEIPVSEGLQSLGNGRVAYTVTSNSAAASMSGKLVSGDVVSVYVNREGISELPPELTYVEVLYATTSEGTDQNDGETPSDITTVTLLVTPKQALKLTDYEYNANIHLALAYRGSSEIAQQFIDKQAEAGKE